MAKHRRRKQKKRNRATGKNNPVRHEAAPRAVQHPTADAPPAPEQPTTEASPTSAAQNPEPQKAHQPAPQADPRAEPAITDPEPTARAPAAPRGSMVGVKDKPGWELTPYRHPTVTRAKTRMQLGEWEQLAELDGPEVISGAPVTELRLMAAVGHLQKGGEAALDRARTLLLEAMDAGADRKLIARMLIAGASNTLGRLAALTGRSDQKVLEHFRSAISISDPEADVDLMLHPMAARQLMRLAQTTGSNSIKEMAKRTARSMAFSESEIEDQTDQQENTPPPTALAAPTEEQPPAISIPAQVTVDGVDYETRLVPNHSETCVLADGILTYELPGKTPCYFVTNAAGDFESPASFHRIPLKPNAAYQISAEIPCEGDQRPIFWFFEYTGGKKVASHSYPARNGRSSGHFRTGANPEVINFGIRLGGSGKLQTFALQFTLHSASNKTTFPINVSDKKYLITLPDWETDYIQGMLANNTTPYELDMLQAMSTILKKDDLVLDIGANIGNHSLYLAVVADCRVIAFEPNPALAAPLRESIAINNLEHRVSLVEKGVGETKARAIFLDPNPANIGAQSLTLIDDTNEPKSRPMEVIPLDSMRFDHPVKAVKIDVEGMELAVLKGAKNLLEKDRPHLFVESHDKDNFSAIHGLLREQRYVYWQTFNATPTNWFLPQEIAITADLQQHGLEQGRTIYNLWEEGQRLRKALRDLRNKET